jgi:hypothetical protein
MNTALYHQILHALPSITGWCTEQKALTLASIVVAARPERICEVGVFGGKSLIPMAMAAEAIHQGTVFAIDPWAKQASVDGMDPINADWWGRLDHEAIYQGFLSQLEAHKLKHRVDIQRVRSDDAFVPEQIGLLSIDGNHGQQAIKDAQRFGAKVALGGYCVCDDLEWTGGGPAAAVEELRKLGFTELYRVKTDVEHWGVYQRVNP